MKIVPILVMTERSGRSASGSAKQVQADNAKAKGVETETVKSKWFMSIRSGRQRSTEPGPSPGEAKHHDKPMAAEQGVI